MCNHTELGQARVSEPRVLPLWRPVAKGMSSVVVLKYIINSEAHIKSNIEKRRVGMARTRTPVIRSKSDPGRGNFLSPRSAGNRTAHFLVFEPFRFSRS